MKLDPKKVRAGTIGAALEDWPRIIPREHRESPTGAGFGASRFSSPTKSFAVLYAAEDFATSFAEAVVRDRFVGKTRRYLYRPTLESLCLTAISSDRELQLLDLTGAASYELGIDSDASRARKHDQGQALAEALYKDFPKLDGILFDSRLTTKRCVAIFDRALAELSATKAIPLTRAALLPVELKRLGIILRRKRGFRAE